MPRFLIVDDHRNTRDALQLGLAVLGIEADTAGHAAGATALAERHRYDAVICDVRMPDVDGITLGTRLRAMDPTVPLIFMTAYEVAPAEEEALRTLKATLLIKPVTATRIATAVCDVGQEPPPGSVDDRTALER